MATEKQLSVMAKSIAEVQGKLGREMTDEELIGIADQYFNVMNPPGWIATPLSTVHIGGGIVDCLEWKGFSDSLLGLSRVQFREAYEIATQVQMHYTVSETNFIYECRARADEHAKRVGGEVTEVPDRIQWAHALATRGFTEVREAISPNGNDIMIGRYIQAIQWETERLMEV